MTDTIIVAQTPNQPADSGGVVNRSVGEEWRTDQPNKRISSCRYWVPAAGIGAGTLIQMWLGAANQFSYDLNALLPAPALDAMNTVNLPVPFDPAQNLDYVVCVALDGPSFYRYSVGQGYPTGSGGSVTASRALYVENLPGIGTGPPVNFFPGGLYFVDVNVDDIPPPPSGGAAFATLFVATMCD